MNKFKTLEFIMVILSRLNVTIRERSEREVVVVEAEVRVRRLN